MLTVPAFPETGAPLDIGNMLRSKEEAEENEDGSFEFGRPDPELLFGDRGDFVSILLLLYIGEERDADSEDAESEIKRGEDLSSLELDSKMLVLSSSLAVE